MTAKLTPDVAHEVLFPYYTAVRERFLAYPDADLEKLKKTRFSIDPAMRDTARHFAGCREDGLAIMVAPELATEVEEEQAVAILAHELGHAADFAYPACWRFVEAGKPALWQPPAGKGSVREVRRWQERGPHLVEVTADAIAMAVTGRKIGYAGPCMLQKFDAKRERPEWLR